MASLYNRIGHWLYDTGNRIEASLYGLKQRTLRLNGIEHSVWTSNNADKPALLLIHGFSASHSVWLRFARFFSKDFFVIIPDLAGHGESRYSDEDNYSIAQQCERMCLLLDSLGKSKAHIAGNSMGGFMAAHMGRYHSERCHSIVLVDPAGVHSPEPSPMLEMLAQGQNPFFIDNQQHFQRFYGMVMASPPYMPNIVLSAICEQYKLRKRELGKIFSDYNRTEDFLDNELARITCPSLVIWGAKDQLIDVSSAQVWQGQLNCQSIVWDDLGHMPMIEAPKRAAQAVSQFIRALAMHRE